MVNHYASALAIHPTHDLSVATEGSLWLKSTDIIYIYTDCQWKKIPSRKELFMAIDGETDSVSTVNGDIVHHFVWPGDSNNRFRLNSVEWSHSWSNTVPSGMTDEHGMQLIISDANDDTKLFIGRAKPSTYQAFSSSDIALYTPNPGDVLKVIVRKMQNFPTGKGILTWLKLNISPL